MLARSGRSADCSSDGMDAFALPASETLADSSATER